MTKDRNSELKDSDSQIKDRALTILSSLKITPGGHMETFSF